jgi:hypothetical protein
MVSSALFMASLGFIATFAPQEVLDSLGSTVSGYPVLLVQLIGALYLGFAFLNWMAQGQLIGGIYGRPVAVANFAHFFIMAITLWREVFVLNITVAVAVGALVYLPFAAWFGWVLFWSPVNAR